MAITTTLIYTPAMLKSLGFLSWGACLLTLSYESVIWLFSGTWPGTTVFSVLNTLFGLDLLSVTDALSLEMTAKLLYVTLNTELALFFWWAGVAMFLILFFIQLTRK